MDRQWMIYGANGYSAKLAAEKAAANGMKPILAGRNPAAIEELASSLDLPHRVFALDSVDAVAAQLADIAVVSHCAGPFSATAETMMRACIAAGTHYTDITGEFSVFETGQALHAQAQQAGVVIMSGVGFDVIPTDCITAYLHRLMPDATELTLAFKGNTAVSPGTMKTMIEGLSDGMKVRRDGAMRSVGMDFEMRDIDYGDGPVTSAVLPWGDLSTAHWQTGIPNITVYMPFRGNKLQVHLFPLIKNVMKSKWLQNKLKAQAAKRPGPSAERRANSRTRVYGEMKNAAGDSVVARIEVGDGYTVTMDGIIMTAQFLLDYDGAGGYFTPAQLMGAEMVEQLPGAGKFTSGQ